MRKQLSIILAILMLSACTSCGGGEVPSDTTAPDSDIQSTTPEETEPDLLSDLPTGSYGGYTFKILGPSEGIYLYTKVVVEEADGEPVNDAIYKRNQQVEEDLDIKLEYIDVGVGSINSTFRTSVLAGDNDYDAVFDQALKIGPAAADGIYYDIYELDKLDLTKPWWDSNTAEQYQINGKLYMIQGDINYQYLYNMWSFFANQKLITDHNLEDLYDVVLDGRWTLDTMSEYCRTVMQDLNGDGVYSLADGDICGLVSNSSSFLALLHGSGESLVSKDKNVPVFKGVTDSFSNVYDKLLKIVGDGGVFTDYGSMTNEERFGLFASDKFLFSAMMVGSSEHLRDMQADFAVLPLPKYDEAQEDYYSYVGPSVMDLCLPVNMEDPDRTGTIIENLCAHSYGTIREAYFETTLQAKFLRDENSVRMLDIIYNNITVELGYVYGFGGIHTTFMNALKDGKGIASEFASVESSVKTAISALLGKLEK